MDYLSQRPESIKALNAFKNRCAAADHTLASCVGYFIEKIVFDAAGETDSLAIALRKGPQKPDVMISLSNLYFTSITKPPGGLHACFVDAISLTHLPQLPHPWPESAEGRVCRFDELPELVWLRIVGPAELDIIASIVTIYTAAADDDTSAPPP
ncbi:hypothetical protein [Amycolatopsis taiwanensis]|uniref:Uncharacterized protein n=1 Tax=Amycolatopsis taiwanensis TaxID=342230 RepID=A0A9W6RCJ9_9PSEU|nr:hypothetical protein [Amycolatopsis taiwanensis]GLY71562.1 hypothetical protein Atai01_81810 [Amycolatopsis taiwanensis]